MAASPDWTTAAWRTSVVSDGGACVEVATSAGLIGVRDSKDQGAGPILEFNRREWTAFLAGVHGGEFDLDTLQR